MTKLAALFLPRNPFWWAMFIGYSLGLASGEWGPGTSWHYVIPWYPWAIGSGMVMCIAADLFAWRSATR